MAKKANAKPAMTTKEAGRIGGRKTARKHGKEFYQTIGKKSGQAVKKLIQEGKNLRNKIVWDSPVSQDYFYFKIAKIFVLLKFL